MKNIPPDHIESRDCWCEPECLQPCPECDKDPDCWKCEGTGLVAEFDDTEASIIVHRGQGSLPHPDGDDLPPCGLPTPGHGFAIALLIGIIAMAVWRYIDMQQNLDKGHGVTDRTPRMRWDGYR